MLDDAETTVHAAPVREILTDQEFPRLFADYLAEMGMADVRPDFAPYEQADDQNTAAAFALRVHGHLVGFALVLFYLNGDRGGAKEAALRVVYVDPLHRVKGRPKRLLSAVTDFARANEATALLLHAQHGSRFSAALERDVARERLTRIGTTYRKEL